MELGRSWCSWPKGGSDDSAGHSPTGYAGLFQRNSFKVNKFSADLGLSLPSLPLLGETVATRVARCNQSVLHIGLIGLSGQEVRYADGRVSKYVHRLIRIQRFGNVTRRSVACAAQDQRASGAGCLHSADVSL
ncbi:protein of unknown function [Streptomyces murinus]